MAGVQVVVEMTANDFENMMVDGFPWAGAWDSWQQQITRFAAETPGSVSPSPELKFAYWFERWTDVVLARSFVATLGYDYEISTDEGHAQYVIHTDFASPRMVKNYTQNKEE